jgi:hypothetical protein
VKTRLPVPKQFPEYIHSFSDGFFLEFGNGRVSISTYVAIWKMEWEGISQCIVIVIILSLSEVGLAVNSVCHFPFWCFMTNLRNSAWFSNPPFVGVSKESSGNTTVMFIWFSICAIPVDDSIIVLQKELRRSMTRLI